MVPLQAPSATLPEIWLPLGSGLGNLVPSGSVKLRAEWRPLRPGAQGEIHGDFMVIS